MEQNILESLVNNAGLLLVLSVIYEVTYLLPARFNKTHQVMRGLFIALICIGLMNMPFVLKSGIIFDTRSIIISVTALVFGFVPTAIAATTAIVMRVFIGGAGSLPGILVIIVSAVIGLAWRRWLYPEAGKLRALNIIAMSIAVHVSMLFLMLLLPYPDNIEVIGAITLPVMLIYPLATLLLCLLLMRQQALRNAREELRQSEEKFKLLFLKAPLGYQSLDEEGYFLDVNQQWCELLGYDKEEVIGRWFGDFLSPENQGIFRQRFPLFKERGQIHSEFEMKKKDGSSIFIAFEGKIGYNLAGGFQQTHCILQDITMRKQTEKALVESERSKSVLLSNLPGMAYRCSYDRDWTMRYVSEGSIELTGYSPESLVGSRDLTFNDLIPEEYHEPLWEEWKRILESRKPFRYEYEIISKDGERKWVLEMGEGIYDDKGEVEALEGIIIDISDRKELERKLKYINEHDSWTGLYNLRYLEVQLLKDSFREQKPKRALVSINLNAINVVSMSYGFSYSRELIRRIADSLGRHCSEERQLFHTYENNFVFYIKDYLDKFSLTEFCEDVANTLEAILAAERIGGGLGILELEGTGYMDFDLILRNLMLASEKAASYTGGDFELCFYDKAMEANIIREQDIERELSQIIEHDEPERFFMKFQPIMDLQSNMICGFEALARLDSKKYGEVSPVEFIPIAEKTKLIIPLGYKIIRLSLDFLSELERKGFKGIKVAINISVIQLLRNGFVRNLERLVKDMGVDPSNVGIELTESVFASNHQEVNSILMELRALGISVSLDDFGTGYSSLSRERELNIDCLKIDRSFIKRLSMFEDDHAITADIISMGHKLGHCVIAEGVDEETQLDYLRRYGCDKVQGYLIAMPLHKQEAIARVKNQEVSICKD